MKRKVELSEEQLARKDTRYIRLTWFFVILNLITIGYLVYEIFAVVMK